MVYYNELDPFAARWLDSLIAQGHIAAGHVDRRDVRDVTAADIRGYCQHHWFAGIGVWSYALRLVGWPDECPVWTGSCPCQPFSNAGAQLGFVDKRHLWPSWYHLIRVCRPPIIFGEQVASKAALQWFDLVQDDLEGAGYAIGAADLCAASVGAPHIRQRLWFVADANNTQRGTIPAGRDIAHRPNTGWSEGTGNTEGRSDVDFMAPSAPERCSRSRRTRDGRNGLEDDGPLNYWNNADWLPCQDGKARPVEPGTFPLADGAPARVGRLRGYGNALVAPLAAAFIRAYMETKGLDSE